MSEINIQENANHPRQRYVGNNSQKQNAKRRKKEKKLIVTVAVCLVVFLLGIFLFNSNLGGSNDLCGLWSIDGITKYEFEKGSKGEMQLPSNSYSFRYTVDGTVLTIDFEDDSLTDASYYYEVTDNTLTITNTSTASVYTMTKED